MFVHYSKHDLNGVFDRGQEKGYSLKPQGLWISDESDYGWKEWCEINAPDFLGSRSYEITLDDNANVLYLRTVEDILAFSYCYRMDINDIFNHSEYTIAIDWLTLSNEYDGIIITPYQWECRIGCPAVWYYCWDVSSGCIWNAKAIKEVKEIL
jgi:hypothetical protein